MSEVINTVLTKKLMEVNRLFIDRIKNVEFQVNWTKRNEISVKFDGVYQVVFRIHSDPKKLECINTSTLKVDIYKDEDLNECWLVLRNEKRKFEKR